MQTAFYSHPSVRVSTDQTYATIDLAIAHQLAKSNAGERSRAQVDLTQVIYAADECGEERRALIAQTGDRIHSS